MDISAEKHLVMENQANAREMEQDGANCGADVNKVETVMSFLMDSFCTMTEHHIKMSEIVQRLKEHIEVMEKNQSEMTEHLQKSSKELRRTRKRSCTEEAKTCEHKKREEA